MSLVMMAWCYALTGFGLWSIYYFYIHHQPNWMMIATVCMFINLGCAIFWTIKSVQGD